MINRDVRHAIKNIIKSLMQSSILITLIIFFIIFLLFDNLSVQLFETSFLSIFFYIISYIDFVNSFDDLYKNDRVRLPAIINFFKSIFQISIYTFFLDVLFTMSINIYLMIGLALIITILIIIINCTNKTDYPIKLYAGYDGLIALANSLIFYIPYSIIAFHFKIITLHSLLYMISIISAVFMDFLVPIINHKKFSIFNNSIKIIYILIFILYAPYAILINDILKPTFLGNISIFFASLIALFIVDLQTRIYKYKHNL